MKKITFRVKQNESKPSIEIEKIKIEHYKNATTCFLTVLGAEVTLLGTVFKSSPKILWGCIAIGLAVISSMSAMAAAEGHIRKLSGPAKTKFQKFMNSDGMDFAKQLLGAGTFSGSVICYTYFAINTLLNHGV